ncbi:MAG TPA: hypothetical protein VEF34_11645 [Syntrophobacteraceae bacterium]|nr:hypothetical protein [Syntrophobacteraceae bacterium]
MLVAGLEIAACSPEPLNLNGFNSNAIIPYGLSTEHIKTAMQDFLDFLSFINVQLFGRNIPRLESFLMPANFSSMVGEFIVATIPKYCQTVTKNTYHNGHPDLLPKGMYPGDSVLHAPEGIEIKGSRHERGWQGHNAEDVWLMVFVFDSNTARDAGLGVSPKPFTFRKVVGAKISRSDWQFSGRSKTSRRTITASVTASGFNKMEANWIYRRS